MTDDTEVAVDVEEVEVVVDVEDDDEDVEDVVDAVDVTDDVDTDGAMGGAIGGPWWPFRVEGGCDTSEADCWIGEPGGFGVDDVVEVGEPPIGGLGMNSYPTGGAVENTRP